MTNQIDVSNKYQINFLNQKVSAIYTKIVTQVPDNPETENKICSPRNSKHLEGNITQTLDLD